MFVLIVSYIGVICGISLCFGCCDFYLYRDKLL